MPALPDDPELVATFRAEVEERLASLSSGLLALEASISPADRARPLNRGDVAALFRDAHTIKGSARLLGVDGWSASRTRLRTCSARFATAGFPCGRSWSTCCWQPVTAWQGPVQEPILICRTSRWRRWFRRFAASRPRRPARLSGGRRLCRASAQLRGVRRRRPTRLSRPPPPPLQRPRPRPAPPPVPPAPAPPPRSPPPRPAAASLPDQPAAAPRSPAAEVIRVGTEKVLGLLEIVGETEVEAHRLEAHVASCEVDAQRLTAAIRVLRARLDAALVAPEITAGIARVSAEADLLGGSFQQLKELAEDHSAQMARLRDASAGLVMVPMRHLTDRFPRLVRDVARRPGRTCGWLSRVRTSNSTSRCSKLPRSARAPGHQRRRPRVRDTGRPAGAGKPDEATVTVRVSSAGGTVRVEVADDGRGIDDEALRAAAVRAGVLAPEAALTDEAVPIALFAPAVSTAGTVTETSGRGVGLDVVRTAVEELGGALTVGTQAGLGTTFTVILPVTLGVLRCLLARVGGERYAVPVASLSRTLSLRGRPRQTSRALRWCWTRACCSRCTISAQRWASGASGPRTALSSCGWVTANWAGPWTF